MEETGRTNKKADEMEGKTRQKHGKTTSQRMGKKGVGVVVGVGVSMYIYNRLLCISMYIISVYMYIYTAPWGKIFNT